MTLVNAILKSVAEWRSRSPVPHLDVLLPNKKIRTMKATIIHSLICAFGVLVLIGCHSTPSAVVSSAGGLPLVEGSWRFSHMGPPTVWNSEMPDSTKLIKAQFKNARFVFDNNGNGSLSMAGQANTMKFEVEEETRTFLKLQVQGEPDQQPLIYDKSDRSLMLPINLEIPGSKGIVPTYFRRGR